MSCIYIYKGHSFNSELELDDFLLTNAKLEPLLGDVVFSLSPSLASVCSTIETIRKDSREINKKYRQWKKSNKLVYSEEGDVSFEEPPYIGVNKFLSGLLDESGNLLFPEFREEEYWKRRYDLWKEGLFNDDEIETFLLNKSNLPKISNLSQQKSLREKMEKRWETQAKIGTAIHNILLLYFTKIKGKYVYEFPNKEEFIRSHVDQEDLPYLNDKTYKDTIKYAESLKSALVSKYGNDLAFYPELSITLEATKGDKPVKLMGILDLCIIDNKGKTHILDYKTSVHPYPEFNSVKKSAYKYQLSTYQRMVQKYGINTYEGDLMIAPIQITNFRLDGDKWVYGGISTSEPFILLDVTSKKIWDNIDEFMPEPFKLNISAEGIGKVTADIMSKWFPSYSSTRKITEDYVIKKLKKDNALVPDTNGVYVYKKVGYKESPITATSEVEFVKKVTDYMLSLPAYRLRYTSQIKSALKEGIKNGILSVKFPSAMTSSRGEDVDWLRDTLSLYCDGTWEVVDNETIESYGLIMLKTKDNSAVANLIDFVRVSTLDLTYNYNFDNKNRRGLTGAFESDVLALSKTISNVNGKIINGSLMAEAVNGNIELMESMLLINLITGIEGKTIGSIKVVNPCFGNGVSLSNELLLYCFNELNKHVPAPINNFENGRIKLATKLEIVKLKYSHIMEAGEEHEWKDEYAKFQAFKSCKSVLDLAIGGNSEEQITALLKLLKELVGNERLQSVLQGTYTTQSYLTRKEVDLYNSILTAIADLKGINFRQQLRDHDKWLESIFIWNKGVSGSYLDNPGNLSSDTLNLVTKLVMQAYLNTRDELLKEKIKVSRLVENLKKSKGFGTLLEHTVGNLAALYANLYKETSDGDLLFKRPEEIIDTSERELLEYALEKINKNRFPDATDEQLELMKRNGDTAYYLVPLAIGGMDSIASTRGLLSVLKAKLSYLNPKVAYMRALKKVEGVFNALDEQEERDLETKSLLLYKMTNLFDLGLKENSRLATIKSEGIENFERNLETLLLKHEFAYSVQKNMDTVFPMIKAAMIHILSEGAMLNRAFKDDILYLEEYIKNKILNLSIVNPKLLSATTVLGMVKLAASKLTLAFAPVQMFYLPLLAIWQEISLAIRKPDGTSSFTFRNFLKANKIVYSDLFHYSDNPTLCSSLNELFGINDMDMNTYIERISSARKGLWNFDNMMFKFASRPDYYNRMAIFLSQMMGDGCLDAIHMNSNHLLVYDWKLDKRFEAFANNDKSDLAKYNSQRSLYYSVAQQFVREHAKNADGTDFLINMNKPAPLPRVYTNLQAESMKSLADDIYGYYSHEKKSLIMSTAIGSLWLLFKTYWSGKKNQYLGASGVKLRGKWKLYEENGKKYYYLVDANGNILYNQPPTTTETIAPVYLWEGLWQEGIILTLVDMVKEMYHLKSFKGGWDTKWNVEDENLRTTYRSNLKLLAYDTLMFTIVGSILGALLGDWLKDLKDDNKNNTDFTTGLGIAAANVAVMSVKNSFLDINFIDSIGTPVGLWTPFAFDWGSRTISNWWNVAMGDEDFWDGVVKTSGGLKQIKPVLDTIKPNMFKTEREGGTFGKE